jgi:hypothetical protein
MKTRYRQVKTRFGRPTRFEIGAIPPVPFRGTLERELEILKGRLLKKMLAEAAGPELNAPLRRAANEAASVAWFTPFPLLFFPTLLEEKARTILHQEARQREIRRRSSGLLEKAAA